MFSEAGWKRPGAENDFCMDELLYTRFVGVARGVTWTWGFGSSVSSSESDESEESLSESIISRSAALGLDLGERGDIRPTDVLREVSRRLTVMRVTSIPTSSPQTSCLRFNTNDRRSVSVSGAVGLTTLTGGAGSTGGSAGVFFWRETIALPRLVVEKTRSGRCFFRGLGLFSVSDR